MKKEGSGGGRNKTKEVEKTGGGPETLINVAET